MNLSENMFKRIPAVQFTYDLWRSGSLSELGIRNREWSLKLHLNYIKEMAVGYTEGEKLHVRAKNNTIAVMFFVNNKHFWTHLTTKEFILCFPELEISLKNIKK